MWSQHNFTNHGIWALVVSMRLCASVEGQRV